MMTSRPRDLRFALIAALVALSSAFFIFQFADPNLGGKFWPRCVFHDVTGWHCPGCGSTRALHALCHGDISAAILKNSLLVLSLPFLLLVGARQIWNQLRPEKALWPRFRLPSWAILTIGGVFTLYAVLRNLPAFDFLAPR